MFQSTTMCFVFGRLKKRLCALGEGSVAVGRFGRQGAARTALYYRFAVTAAAIQISLRETAQGRSLRRSRLSRAQ